MACPFIFNLMSQSKEKNWGWHNRTNPRFPSLKDYTPQTRETFCNRSEGWMKGILMEKSQQSFIFHLLFLLREISWEKFCSYSSRHFAFLSLSLFPRSLLSRKEAIIPLLGPTHNTDSVWEWARWHIWNELFSLL